MALVAPRMDPQTDGGIGPKRKRRPGVDLHDPVRAGAIDPALAGPPPGHTGEKDARCRFAISPGGWSAPRTRREGPAVGSSKSFSRDATHGRCGLRIRPPIDGAVVLMEAYDS